MEDKYARERPGKPLESMVPQGKTAEQFVDGLSIKFKNVRMNNVVNLKSLLASLIVTTHKKKCVNVISILHHQLQPFINSNALKMLR